MPVTRIITMLAVVLLLAINPLRAGITVKAVRKRPQARKATTTTTRRATPAPRTTSTTKTVKPTAVKHVSLNLSAPWTARHGLTGAQYQSTVDALRKKGFRLTQVSVHTVGNQPLFSAIFEKRPGPAMIARHGLTGAQYQAEYEKQRKSGFRLVLIEGYGVGNKAYYAAIWEKRTGPSLIARHGLTGKQYQAEYDKQRKNGYRLVQVEGYGVGNKAYYAAIWEKRTGPSLITKHGLTASQYQNECEKQLKNGYRLTHISAYNVGSRDYYAAIWEKRSGKPLAARHGLTAVNYQAEFDNFVYSGYRLTHICGYTKGSSRYAAIWENTGPWSTADLRHIDKTVGAFMKKHSVPGAGVAIAKDGRLVYARGFGFADKSAGELVGPNNRFRLASISKTITSVAILRLVEQGKLKLSDKVFGPGGILGTKYGSKPLSDNERAITVRHLLEHTAGGVQWDNKSDDGSSDPMFTNPSFNHGQLIGWVLDNRAVTSKPGTKYAYSNFGYCVLGRIIEKKTGMKYETYVRNTMLKPIGADGMRIGGDTKSQRYPGEVVYHDGGGGDPYGMKVRRMDSHGGWIASPIDLVRFGVRVDGFNTKPDIIKKQTFDTMVKRTGANKDYALGWSVNSSGNAWHGGSLPGTRTILVRTSGGFVWAFLLNTRRDDDTFGSDLDKTMWDVVNGVKNWPKFDLF